MNTRRLRRRNPTDSESDENLSPEARRLAHWSLDPEVDSENFRFLPEDILDLRDRALRELELPLDQRPSRSEVRARVIAARRRYLGHQANLRRRNPTDSQIVGFLAHAMRSEGREQQIGIAMANKALKKLPPERVSSIILNACKHLSACKEEDIDILKLVTYDMDINIDEALQGVGSWEVLPDWGDAAWGPETSPKRDASAIEYWREIFREDPESFTSPNYVRDLIYWKDEIFSDEAGPQYFPGAISWNDFSPYEMEDFEPFMEKTLSSCIKQLSTTRKRRKPQTGKRRRRRRKKGFDSQLEDWLIRYFPKRMSDGDYSFAVHKGHGESFDLAGGVVPDIGGADSWRSLASTPISFDDLESHPFYWPVDRYFKNFLYSNGYWVSSVAGPELEEATGLVGGLEISPEDHLIGLSRKQLAEELEIPVSDLSLTVRQFMQKYGVTDV